MVWENIKVWFTRSSGRTPPAHASSKLLNTSLSCCIHFHHSTMLILGSSERGVMVKIRKMDREGNRRWKRHWQGEKSERPLLSSVFYYSWVARGRRRRDCSFSSFPWVQPCKGPSASSLSTSYPPFFHFPSLSQSFSTTYSCLLLHILNWRCFAYISRRQSHSRRMKNLKWPAGNQLKSEWSEPKKCSLARKRRLPKPSKREEEEKDMLRIGRVELYYLKQRHFMTALIFS